MIAKRPSSLLGNPALDPFGSAAPRTAAAP